MNQNIPIQYISSKQCFERLSEESSSYLVDVRTKPEWMFVGLPDLQSLNKQTICVSWHVYPEMEINVNFESEILKSGINKQDAIFFICRSGHRSQDAAEFLASRGFTDCFNVIDGFEGENDPNHQRSTINGWKYYKLPWKQR
jgi:rhodanese-related sulfurtransferase